MIYGFIGTHMGLTQLQRTALSEFLATLDAPTFHHGGCRGADAEFAAMVTQYHTTVHPCTVVYMHDKRSLETAQEILPMLPPPTRNRNIVDACEHLLACPGALDEEIRSGTWAIVRYARRVGKSITLLWPDGSITHETL